MDSSKTAYEPVSTEEEVEVVVAAPEDATETAPIVETAPETPPEVAEKNEKNAEKTAAAEKEKEKEEEKKEEKAAEEQNGNVSLDLDSSIVPLKEAEEVPHSEEVHANGKLNGENGMVSIEIEKEEMQVEGGDLKTKKQFHCPKCPKCPSLPAWRPTKWTPSPPKNISICSRKQKIPEEEDEEEEEKVKEEKAEEEKAEKEEKEETVVPVEEVEGAPEISYSERYRWIAVVSFLGVALLVFIILFALMMSTSHSHALHPHGRDFELHVNCDCPDNDIVFNATSAVAGNETSAATTVSTTKDLTTFSGCLEACVDLADCVAVVFEEEEEDAEKRCALKSICEEMNKTVGKMLVLKR